MNSIQNWLRQFSARMGAGLRGFMAGRYGTDKLNMLILGIGLVASLLSMWIRVPDVYKRQRFRCRTFLPVRTWHSRKI